MLEYDIRGAVREVRVGVRSRGGEGGEERERGRRGRGVGEE